MNQQAPQQAQFAPNQIPTQAISGGPIPKSKPKFDIEKNWKLNYAVVALCTALLVTVIGLGSLSGYFFYQYSKANQNEIYAIANETRQKNLKDTLDNAYNKQAALNEDMVKIQERLLQESKKYQTELLRNFKITNSKAEAIPGQQVDNLRSSEDKLYDILNDMDSLIEKNAKQKQQLQDEINSAFKLAEQEQKNRLNPRDGIRE
jgi:hypothetical protein